MILGDLNNSYEVTDYFCSLIIGSVNCIVNNDDSIVSCCYNFHFNVDHVLKIYNVHRFFDVLIILYVPSMNLYSKVNIVVHPYDYSYMSSVIFDLGYGSGYVVIVRDYKRDFITYKYPFYFLFSFYLLFPLFYLKPKNSY